MENDPYPLEPNNLRAILKYVPQWREHIFVIGMDAGVTQHPNFANILLDIAVLQNLNIRVVLVFGIGQRIEILAHDRNLTISDLQGEAPTDDATLLLAIEASGLIGHEIMSGLQQNGLKCVIAQPVRATEMGILKGQDQLNRGKVDKVDAAMIRLLLANQVMPIIPPVAFSHTGTSLRLNSDLMAAEIALALQSSKLIYLTTTPGLTINGEFVINITVKELQKVLEQSPESLPAVNQPKIRQALRAISGGIPRAHIIDGRLNEGLLTEIFSSVGIGSMIYANEYTQVRAADWNDAQSIFNITQNAVRDESLKPRSRQDIEDLIEHFFIYEIDRSIIGCACLKPYEDSTTCEIESVYVQPFYQGKGVGHQLVEYAVHLAKKRGCKHLIALSTQSASFFKTACGFKDASLEDLPQKRREELEKSGRNSRILIREL
jgi:amino-acid N-acetyltransferase